jgi:hypothetical protein
MMKTNFLYVLAILALGLSFTSCDDDDDDHDHDHGDNEITITIEEPTDGEVITECDDVHVHIEITATDEIHDVEIVLHPEGDVDDKIIDYDEHSHESELDFDQDVNLCSYDAGQCFHLEVKVCKDHDCEETETAEVEFCLE